MQLETPIFPVTIKTKELDGLKLVSVELSNYHKVAISRLSQLAAHLRVFRLFMKEKFDAYVPFAKRV